MLRALPAEAFPARLTVTPRVDRLGASQLIGRRVRAVLGACDLVVYDGRTEVARHERATVKASQTLLLDHCLEVLSRKPGALPGATALAQARGAGTFTDAHDAFWPRPVRRTATRAAPGPWWRCCCCTDTSPIPTWSPALPPP